MLITSGPILIPALGGYSAKIDLHTWNFMEDFMTIKALRRSRKDATCLVKEKSWRLTGRPLQMLHVAPVKRAMTNGGATFYACVLRLSLVRRNSLMNRLRRDSRPLNNRFTNSDFGFLLLRALNSQRVMLKPKSHSYRDGDV